MIAFLIETRLSFIQIEANLVDFDALWGHRRNPQGYAEELEKFDVLLGQFLEKMKEDIQEQSRQLIWIQNIWIWQKRGSQL